MENKEEIKVGDRVGFFIVPSQPYKIGQVIELLEPYASVFVDADLKAYTVLISTLTKI